MAVKVSKVFLPPAPEQMTPGTHWWGRRETYRRYSADLYLNRMLKFNSFQEGIKKFYWGLTAIQWVCVLRKKEREKLTPVGSFPEVLQRHPVVADSNLPRKQGTRLLRTPNFTYSAESVLHRKCSCSLVVTVET